MPAGVQVDPDGSVVHRVAAVDGATAPDSDESRPTPRMSQRRDRAHRPGPQAVAAEPGGLPIRKGRATSPVRSASSNAVALRYAVGVLDDPVTAADLRNAWREATQAAVLAERLAILAADTVARADIQADVADEVAAMAEQAATSAIAAADRARRAAEEARRIANEAREGTLQETSAARDATRVAEREARDAYHAIEHEAQATDEPRD